MVNIKTNYTINGNIVFLEKDLGKGYKIYAESCSICSSQKYITCDDKVLFSLYVEADGDECAHISEFDITLLDE